MGRERFRLLLSTLLFLIVFLLLAHRSRYEVPRRLEIQIRARGAVPALLQWDTGSGFNEYESEPVMLAFKGSSEPAEHEVTIERIGRKNAASTGREVRIEYVLAEDNTATAKRLKELDRRSAGTELDWGRLVLVRDGARVVFRDVFPSKKLFIVLMRNPASGEARVTFDGRSRVVDLYAPARTHLILRAHDFEAERTWQDTVTLSLPQVRLSRIKLRSTEGRPFRVEACRLILEKRRCHPLPVSNADADRIVFQDLPQALRAFRASLLAIQAAVAFLIALAFYRFRGFARGAMTRFHGLLTEGRCRRFWALFLVAGVILSVWVLGQWPGMINDDTIVCWHQGTTLEFSNAHPWIYSAYLLAIRQFQNSFAAVAVVQVLALAVLAACIYGYLIEEGLSLRLGIPLFVAFLLVPSTGGYSVSLIKDTPFALLVLLWTFVVFRLWLRRRRCGHGIQMALADVLLLSMAFVLLCRIRHNGVVYVVAIPALILFGRLMRRRTFLTFAGFSGLLIVSLVALGQWGGIYARTPQRRMSVSWKLHALASLLVHPEYVSTDHDRDRQVIEKLTGMTIEEIRSAYRPNTFDTLFWGHVSKRNVSAEEVREVNRLYVRGVMRNLPLFIASRSRMFLAALGSDSTVTFYANNLWQPGRRYALGFYKELYAFRYAPVWKPLKVLTERYLQFSTKGTMRALLWNAKIALAVLVVILFGCKWFPCSAAAATVPLVQVPALFVVLPTAEFRLIYFLYCAPFLVVPMLLLEAKENRRRRAEARAAPIIRGNDESSKAGPEAD